MTTTTWIEAIITAALAATLAAAPAAASWIELTPGAAPAAPSPAVSAADDQGTTFTLRFDGLFAEPVSTDDGWYTRVSMAGAGVTTDAGQPLLPVWREQVEILPVLFNPARGTVRVVTSIEIDVDYSAGADWNTTRRSWRRRTTPTSRRGPTTR